MKARETEDNRENMLEGLTLRHGKRSVAVTQKCQEPNYVEMYDDDDELRGYPNLQQGIRGCNDSL